MEIAEETVFPTAEGRNRPPGRGFSNVDADVAGQGFVTEAAGSSATGSERRPPGVAVGAAFEEGEGVVHVVGVDEAEDRAEDFCVGGVATFGNVVEDGGLDEVARFMARDFGVASVEENFCALLFAKADERFGAFFALRRDYRPHLDAVFEAVADPGVCSPASAMESRKVCCASPMVIATDTARQRWPAQPKALSEMICVAMGMSASRRTTT